MTSFRTMFLRYFSPRLTVNQVFECGRNLLTPSHCNDCYAFCIRRYRCKAFVKPVLIFPHFLNKRCICSSEPVKPNRLSFKEVFGANAHEDDETVNEFFSRFVRLMSRRLSERYPQHDKQKINRMISIAVQKVLSTSEEGGLKKMAETRERCSFEDSSQELWKIAWGVSNLVLGEMKKQRQNERLKIFLHCEDVKEMCKFAVEIGVRGALLRELRFKWAHEKMEEVDFNEDLEQLRRENDLKNSVSEPRAEEVMCGPTVMEEKENGMFSLPNRRGREKCKIYGLALSDTNLAKVADKVHEMTKKMHPQEGRPLSAEGKMLTEKILALQKEEELPPILAEWMEFLHPNRVDWINLLDTLKHNNAFMYYKTAEFLLNETTFEPDIHDYFTLIDSYAKESHVEDAERVLKKMTDRGIAPDILILTVLVHMYCKVGNLDRAKEAFERLRLYGFHPDVEICKAVIMAYINAEQPRQAEVLVREMEARDIKPPQEIYLALLQSFTKRSDVAGAGRVATTMHFMGFPPTSESCSLLVEAYSKAGETDRARSNVDYMLKAGHRPSDKCLASMISAYERKNSLDEALKLLLQLEKDGFELGTDTCSVLIGWFAKLQLVDEAEALLGRLVEHGECPPLGIQVSLCDMHARAGDEKKMLHALGMLEVKKEELSCREYEQVINGLIAGGFVQEARRFHSLMKEQGFAVSYDLHVALMASQALSQKRPRYAAN